MTSSTLRKYLLILIFFVVPSANPNYDTCERMEVEAQPGEIVQGWQSPMTTCVGESKTDWKQINQQTSVVCAESDEWLIRPVSQGAIKELEQRSAWVLNTQSESVSNTSHLAMSSDFDVVRTSDSFEVVPVSETNSPAMLYQLTQSQTGTTVVSDKQRITEDDNAFAEAKKERNDGSNAKVSR